MRHRIGPFWRLSLATSILIVSPIARAQEGILWQGSVKPDHINVYSQASSFGQVVSTLSQGQLVNVVLEVRVSNSAWCRVGFPDESEAIGYVLCVNLRQLQSTPKQKTRYARDHTEP